MFLGSVPLLPCCWASSLAASRPLQMAPRRARVLLKAGPCRMPPAHTDTSSTAPVRCMTC
uniref:Uncharacterized protein n=1 Tax=Arundo donax TaxID=35708 RepID=A0A0A9BN72_ARUDO